MSIRVSSVTGPSPAWKVMAVQAAKPSVLLIAARSVPDPLSAVLVTRQSAARAIRAAGAPRVVSVASSARASRNRRASTQVGRNMAHLLYVGCHVSLLVGRSPATSQPFLDDDLARDP